MCIAVCQMEKISVMVTVLMGVGVTGEDSGCWLVWF